jgi:hypothetical protein
MDHEDTLMDEEKGMNINYYTEKTHSKPSRKASKNDSDKDSLEMNPPKQKYTKEELQVPLSSNQPPPPA